ncbi:aminotransferase class III-fold pyridoxal phosphate-dependent enzyme [Arcanobacterium bovis]|nr:aminotransferase class III-fold pyridoxal phosphate-dependent enzyme [Arcanobacterium bovis]
MLIERADGSVLTNNEGDTFLDLTAGGGANALGYNNPIIANYAAANTHKLFEATHHFATEEQIGLATAIQSCLTESGYVGASSRVRFTRSGHEANRAALEIALQFKPRGNIVTFLPVHSDSELYGVVAPVYDGGANVASERPVSSVSAASTQTRIIAVEPTAKALENVVDDDTATIIFSPMDLRSATGVVDEEIFQRASALCERFKALLIMDETHIGMGRTGDWFVHAPYVKADIITVGRGLGGGVPLGATLLLSRRAKQDSDRLSGLIPAGNPFSFDISMLVIDEIRKIFGQINSVGQWLRDELSECGYEVSGKGLLLGIRTQDAEFVQQQLQERGIIVHVGAQDRIELSPPLNISIDHLQLFIDHMKGLAN